MRLQHSSQHTRPHWTRTCRLTALLMVIWTAVNITVILFARELAAMTVLGWPVSFYMAAQGSVLVYLALIGVYAWRMNRYDRDTHRSGYGE